MAGVAVSMAVLEERKKERGEGDNERGASHMLKFRKRFRKKTYLFFLVHLVSVKAK